MKPKLRAALVVAPGFALMTLALVLLAAIDWRLLAVVGLAGAGAGWLGYLARSDVV